ncbi:hypothetical protein B1R45_01585 [Pseudomonas azotoformans]|nr:hypothetical protein B1R45_01585 [Pseudomonas azotoformans]
MKLGNTLPLARCPHCNIAHPHLEFVNVVDTTSNEKQNHRRWITYKCATCGGVTMAVAPYANVRNQILDVISDIWPAPQAVHDSVPERAKAYLEQAIASIAAPSGAVMLTASAVDAMLKAKGLKDGSLNSRINTAAQNHLITSDMAAWAHEVRLDANDQRHDDEAGAMPDEADAKKSIEFATALAQFLFVLPARIARGRSR